MSILSHPFKLVSRCALLSLCLPMVAGCEQSADESLASAINRARYELAAVNPGGTTGMTPDARAEAYAEIAQQLRTRANAGSKSQQASASLLLSQTDQGLASVAVGNARTLDSDMARLLDRASAQFGQYRRQIAFADSLAAYDPGPALAELDAQITEKEETISRYRWEIDELLQQVADFEERMNRKLRSAEQMRQLERDVRERSLTAHHANRAELAIEANTYRRQADTHEKDAAWIEAEIDRIQPAARQAERLVESLRVQRQALSEAQQRVRAGADAMSEDARAARREADAIGQDVSERLHRAIAMYDDQIVSLLDIGFQRLEEAKGRISRARSASRGGAGAAQASVDHLLASVLVERAQIASRLAQAVSHATADPSPTGVEGLAQKARDLRTESEESLARAALLFEEALSSYQSLSVRGDAAQGRLNDLAMKIDALRVGITGEAPEDGGQSGAGEGSDEAING